ncbi:G-type lectin S-receptor-like serine/threonine-protein kinase At1g11330 [Quercus lobata]|uniref:G-type lectin S-receptor-like serine/threonine-protein kinase At1g11330 n=1 Tax=Quercus lobata TaxID=97700 RepID=UPI0012455A96|nr:G-type lectin S-receptor-like serine/threonine-protein kinase At1g11330 [Quercus lobata]
MGGFQHPCDAILPRMKISNNLRTNQKIQLTSWKSPSDPSIGRFSAGINPQNTPHGFIWKDGHPYWRMGPWNGQFFTGAQSWVLDYRSGFTLAYDKEETVYATSAYVNVLGLSKHFLDAQGNSMQIHWDDEKEDWEVVGFTPTNECDVYGTCGAFGNYYALSSPICSCLKGFEPKIVEEWNREWSHRTKDDCRKQCLENCSCVAYAYDTGIGCMSWSGNLIDLQKFSTGGIDLQKFSTGLEANDEAVETAAVDAVDVRELGVDYVGSIGDEGFDLVGVECDFEEVMGVCLGSLCGRKYS